MIEYIVLDVIPTVMHTGFYMTVAFGAIVGVVCVFGELETKGIHDD